MNKKVLIILAVLLAFVTLVGCENKNKEKEPDIIINKNVDEYSMGSWDGDIYVNSFLKLKFKLPSNWRVASNEELSQRQSESFDYDLYELDRDMLKEIIENNMVYYLSAQEMDSGSLVEIVTQRYDDDVTVESHLNDVKKSLEAQKVATYSNIQITKENIMGREMAKLSCVGYLSGHTAKQTIYAEKRSNVIMRIMITDVANDVDVNEMFLKY